MLWMLLLPILSFAQDDLSAIQALDENLPKKETTTNTNDVEQRITREQYRPPYQQPSMDEIKASGTSLGAINEGKTLYLVNGDGSKLTTEHFFTRFYKMPDENGFRYLENKDGSCVYKIRSEDIENIELENALYVPPTRYSPKGPTNVIREEYDLKLNVLPEFSFYAGMVNGSYMKDLFNDNDAAQGITTQYGIHAFTQWKLPVKTGLVFHYEKTIYQHTEGQIVYSAFSLGPQFKSKDLELFKTTWRFQAQFRISPFARAALLTDSNQGEYLFNSGDFLVSIEHALKNSWGEFVIGPFIQIQWLNLKSQSEAVAISASNETNKTFGFFLGQVFE